MKALCRGVRGEHLPARSVTQLTVLSRLAGPIERWAESLQPQAALKMPRLTCDDCFKHF